jgi:serine/threonine protein kinase
MQSIMESLKIQPQRIGQGGFGSIFLAQNDDGDCFAVKKISKAKAQAHNIEREVRAGIALSHPNITNFICHSEDDSNDYMVFDYIRGNKIFFSGFLFF